MWQKMSIEQAAHYINKRLEALHILETASFIWVGFTFAGSARPIGFIAFEK